jgi:hypothetical protein
LHVSIETLNSWNLFWLLFVFSFFFCFFWMEDHNVVSSSPPTITTEGGDILMKTKRKPRRKTLSRASQSAESVPLETVLALRDQLETLEKTYQQELAGHEKLVKKLKSKVKKQKSLLQTAASTGDVAPLPQQGGEHDADQLKEILLLRDRLSSSEAEAAKLRQALRTARAEVQSRGTQSSTSVPASKGSSSSLGAPISSSAELFDEPALHDAQSVLDLSHRRNGLSSKFLSELCTSIRSSTNLVSINFSRTKLTSKQAGMLGAALKGNSPVQAVTLDRCQIGDTGIGALAEALAGNEGVTVLSLRCNRIAAAGSKALATLLQTHASLAELDISLCGIRSEHCASVIAAIPSCNTLVAFAIAGNELGSVGAKVFDSFFGFFF